MRADILEAHGRLGDARCEAVQDGAGQGNGEALREGESGRTEEDDGGHRPDRDGRSTMEK
jgi:hypothetical protein